MQRLQEKTEHGGLLSFAWITVVRDILRRWYIIVVAALLVSMGTYILSDMAYRPSYTTNTTFVVSVRGDSTTVYQNLSATTNLASVFTEVLNSSILHKTILEEVGLASFDGSIRAAAVPETNLLTMRVTASDPRTAFLVTRCIIENHSVVSYQVMGDTVLEVLQDPVVPMAPSNPQSSLALAKKAVIWAAVGMCLLLAVLSYLRDTVRNRKEGEQKLDAICLGELHHERRHKTIKSVFLRRKRNILITKADTSFHFAEAVRKLRRRVEQRLGKDKQVVLVTSVLENEGKSTVAVNLALSLAQKHRRVLLIDCDLRKPACHTLLESPHTGHGTISVITGRCNLKDALTQDNLSGLFLLLEHKRLNSATNLLGSEEMKELLAWCKKAFKYIVVDLPPMSAAPDTESVLEFADAAIMVVQQNAAATSQLNSAIAALNGDEGKLLGYVLNNVYSTPGLPGSEYGYGYGYGKYGKYGKYGRYGGYQGADTSRQ